MAEKDRTGWKGKLGALLLAVVCLLLLFDRYSDYRTKQTPHAKDGVLDLSGWSWERDGLVPLKGQWRFAWLSPPVGLPPDRETTIAVPSMWSDNADGDGNQYPSQGYATYELTVIHTPSLTPLAIWLPNVSTAYELYINGEPAMKRGLIGQDAARTVPYQLPSTVQLDKSSGRIEIRLSVSNFHHRGGGIRHDLIMGRLDQVEAMQDRKNAQSYIIFGCLVMIGLYHIGLFILRRKETASLFFAMLCLFVGLRMGLIGESFLLRWIPEMSWQTAIRLEYAAFVLSGWAGMAYFHRMYPGEIRRIWVIAAGGAAALLCAATALLPTLEFTSWLVAYQAYLLILCAIVIAGLLVGAVRGREGAGLALIGVAVLAAAIVNDMLSYNGWRRSVDLVPFGLLFLILMNSFIISQRAWKTYARAEQMSAELKEWNDRLEGRIDQRTEELRKSYEKLEEANKHLERMELSRRQLVSNISHDLRTPITLIQGYLEALRDGVISDAAQRESTIRLMLGKVEGLNGLIHDLFELSMLEARKVELICGVVTLEEWRERLEELYKLDLMEKSISFTCELGSEADASGKVSIDLLRMDRVFANLLYNAARYTPQGGMIRLTLRRLPEGRKAEITVEDSGAGIHPDDLPQIFDRFYKKDKTRHSSSGGSGLGLAISREIVELHGGSIEAGNRPEGGGLFRITLETVEEPPIAANRYPPLLSRASF